MNRIHGIGTDIVEIERIRDAISRYGQRFLDRLFTVREQQYCLTFRDINPHFAARFAAKEAISKAFGTGVQKSLTWQDIEIINDPLGAPKVTLSAKWQKSFGQCQVHLTMSHCQAYATATALVTKE